METPDSLKLREGRRLAFASGRLRILLELLLMGLCGVVLFVPLLLRPLWQHVLHLLRQEEQPSNRASLLALLQGQEEGP